MMHESNPSICPICKLVVRNDYHRQKHDKNGHPVETPCALCGGMYKKIEIHMNTVHLTDSEKNFQCGNCGKGFRNKSSIDEHAMNVHIKT